MTQPNSLTSDDMHLAAEAATRNTAFEDKLRHCRYAYIFEFIHSLSHTVRARDTQGKLEITYLRHPSSNLTIAPQGLLRAPAGELKGPVLKIASHTSIVGNQPLIRVTDKIHAGEEKLRLTFDNTQVTFGDEQINAFWRLIDETVNPLLVGDPNAGKKAPEVTPGA